MAPDSVGVIDVEQAGSTSYSGMPATGHETSTFRSASHVSFGSTAWVNASATYTVEGGSNDTVNPAYKDIFTDSAAARMDAILR